MLIRPVAQKTNGTVNFSLNQMLPRIFDSKKSTGHMYSKKLKSLKGVGGRAYRVEPWLPFLV